MSKCPITYEEAEIGAYSKKGLRLLSTGLRQLNPISVVSESQLVTKSGVKYYLGDVLSTQDTIEPSDDGNVLVFTPSESSYDQFLENMDVSLKILALAGVETAQGGLVYREDDSKVLVLRRPEAHGKRGRFELTDIDSSSIASTKASIEESASFPMVVYQRLLTRIGISYLLAAPQSGFLNLEIMNKKGKKSLKPAIWVWNTDLFSGDFPANNPIDSINPESFFNELGVDHFGLPQKVVDKVVSDFSALLPQIYSLIEVCFLSDEMKEEYLITIDERWAKLGF